MMGRIGCPETSVRNYHYSLLYNSEQGSYKISPKLPTFGIYNGHVMLLRPANIRQSSLEKWSVLRLNTRHQTGRQGIHDRERCTADRFRKNSSVRCKDGEQIPDARAILKNKRLAQIEYYYS